MRIFNHRLQAFKPSTERTMLYLLWALLNVAPFLFFVVLCFTPARVIKQRFGAFGTMFFLFGFLIFFGPFGCDNQKSVSTKDETWTFASADVLRTGPTLLAHLDLEKTLLSKYQLFITYGKAGHWQTNVPVSARSSTEGFICGTNWKPRSIVLTRTDDNNKFAYHVDGTVEWKLFGATVFYQPKEYNGIAGVN